MFGKIFAFELKYHTTGRLFMFAAGTFFLLTFLAVISPNVQLGNLGGANLNSPWANAQAHSVMVILNSFIATAFLTNAVLRDRDFRMSEMIYSTRITKTSYLLGRFFGAFVAAMLALLATSFGFAAASVMPWLDQELIGPFVFGHYTYSLFVLSLPTLLAVAAIVFAVATLTRDQRFAYTTVVGMLMLNVVMGTLSQQVELRDLAGIFDPSGGSAYFAVAQYWTVFERNTMLVPVEGILLFNRLFWVGMAGALLALTVWRFKFDVNPSKKKAKKAAEEAAIQAEQIPVGQVQFPSAKPSVGFATDLTRFRRRIGFEVKSVIKSIPFWILMALALFTTILSYTNIGATFGTSFYPVTRSMLNVMSGTVTLSLLIVVVFYSADLVWRDREVRYQDILGGTPTPSWVFVTAKIFAALFVVAIFLGLTAAASIGYQLYSGYTNLELGLYAIGHLYDYGTLFYLAVILAVALQILLGNKYLGMMVMIVYIVAIITLPGAGFEDPLYLYGATSATPYSDMNGYGGYLAFANWYNLYWALFGGLLCIFAYLMWSRGPLEGIKLRFASIGNRMTAGTSAAMVASFAGFVLVGGWIYYNTHILNEYQTNDDLQQKQADFEVKYASIDDVPQPRITEILVDVDLYPERRAFAVRANYTVENKNEVPVTDTYVSFNWATNIAEISLEGAELVEADEEFNVFHFRFNNPMLPGQSRLLQYSGGREPQGFLHGNNVPNLLLGGGGVLRNGTFVNSLALGPTLGYDTGKIITNRPIRRRYDLEPIPRFADLDDETHWNDSYLRQDSDWVTFEATVSTSAEQIAMAPGYLIEEREENGRRIFHYKMDAPMQNLYAVLSAEYEVLQETYGDRELSVYYHDGHDMNVERMMYSIKRSIDYFGEHFSDYQYRQMRILEFPAYASFAQSFPNFVPWSENLGFIADIRDPQDIDYVFYIGVHELAHQWWGHQVSSANVQGQTVLVETLAQYSALMVMEKEYGEHAMRRFLKFELDNYLSSRGNETIEEMPLLRVENQQYIHYQKGSIVMYALKDYLGEDNVNEALRRLISESAYSYDPYPRSADLVRHLKDVAETEEQIRIIEDLFERIVLWDFEIGETNVVERSDGRYDVTFTATAVKRHATGVGEESEVDFAMPVDVAVFSQDIDDVFEGDDHVLYMEKRPVRAGENTYTITVDERPLFVGIDPYNKLVDRISEDNIKRIETGGSSQIDTAG